MRKKILMHAVVIAVLPLVVVGFMARLLARGVWVGWDCGTDLILWMGKQKGES